MKISIRLSVLVVLISFVLLVSFSLIYTINNRFNDKLLSLAMDDIEDVVEVCREELSNSVLSVQRANDLLSVDRDFIELLKTNTDDVIETVKTVNKLVKYANPIQPSSAIQNYGYYSCLFVDASQPVSAHLPSKIMENISPNSLSASVSVANNNGLEREEWYQTLMKSEQKIHIFERGDAPNYIFLAQVINNNLDYRDEILAISLVGINFEDILRSHRSIGSKGFLQIMIVNDGGEVICTSDESVGKDIIEFASVYSPDSSVSTASMSSTYISGIEYFVCKYELDFNMTLVAAIPSEEALITIQEISHELFWIVGLILIVALIIAVILSGIIVKPVKRLADFMVGTDELEDLSCDMKISHIREIDSLYNALNEMLMRIKNLITLAQRMGEQKKEAEFKALQAQISPHYLYNALDAISWTALRRGEEDIADMAEALAESFRSNAKGNDMMIDIEDEIKFLKNYVKLQEKCRKGSFTLEVDIEEGLENLKIQKFMIQPLVENAIIHGTGRENKKLNIKISIAVLHDTLKIYTEDDGVGFDAEVLNRYLNGDYAVFDTERIGTINVHRRLQLKYGEQAGLSYMSNERGGLTAIITLPLNKGEKNDEIF